MTCAMTVTRSKFYVTMRGASGLEIAHIYSGINVMVAIFINTITINVILLMQKHKLRERQVASKMSTS
jgi:hypothetical protein